MLQGLLCNILSALHTQGSLMFTESPLSDVAELLSLTHCSRVFSATSSQPCSFSVTSETLFSSCNYYWHCLVHVTTTDTPRSFSVTSEDSLFFSLMSLCVIVRGWWFAWAWGIELPNTSYSVHTHTLAMLQRCRTLGNLQTQTPLSYVTVSRADCCGKHSMPCKIVQLCTLILIIGLF